MLGPNCILVQHTPQGFRSIDRKNASLLQEYMLDEVENDDWLFSQCQRITDALNRGEVALAQIYGLRIPIGEFDDRQLQRLAAIGVAKWSFNPDEPRIPNGEPRGGEWTTGDDNFSIAAPPDAGGSETVLAEFLAGDGDGTSAFQPHGSPAGDAASTGDAEGGDDGSTLSDQIPIHWEMKPLGDAAATNVQPTPDNPDANPLSGPALAAFAGNGSQWLLGDLTPATMDALKLLLARMNGASVVFGILFIPTNPSPIVEGPIAGSPDLSYRYDR